MSKLREQTKWHDVHRGISFEIVRFEAFDHMETQWSWCHYIYVHEFQVPEDQRDRFFLPHELKRWSKTGTERVTYDYYSSAFADLKWPGGITYYEVERGNIPGHRYVKAGCDYQHSWDTGQNYSLDWIVSKAKETIDSLCERVTVIARCGIYGCEKPADEMVEGKDGRLVCVGCEEKWAAEHPPAAAAGAEK